MKPEIVAKSARKNMRGMAKAWRRNGDFRFLRDAKEFRDWALSAERVAARQQISAGAD